MCLGAALVKPGAVHRGSVAPLRLSHYTLGHAFKHNAARRHHIPKAWYQMQNWSAYAAWLNQRCDLALWLDEAAIAEWQAPRRTTPGAKLGTRTRRSNWC